MYVLVAEPLSAAIKQNKNILGLKIPNTDEEAKQFSHADDTTLILSDKTSVNETFKVIDLYSRASGAKLNRNKSEIISLGKGEITEGELKNLNIKESKKVIQLFEIWIGRNNFEL